MRVSLRAGRAWVGMFAFGDFGAAGTSRGLSMPNPEQICVVTRGAGYVVSATHPETWEEIATIPILEVSVGATASP